MKRVRGPSSPVSDVKSYFPRSSTRLKGVKLIFVLNVKCWWPSSLVELIGLGLPKIRSKSSITVAMLGGLGLGAARGQR